MHCSLLFLLVFSFVVKLVLAVIVVYSLLVAVLFPSDIQKPKESGTSNKVIARIQLHLTRSACHIIQFEL